MGYCRFVWECGGALPLVEIWSHEFVKKLVEYEVFIDPVRIECTQLKEFFFRDFCGFLCCGGVRIARKLSSCGESDYED